MNLRAACLGAWILGTGCNGVFGIDEVRQRAERGGGGAGGHVAGAGGADVGGAAAGGAGGSAGAGGDQGGHDPGPTLCEPVPTDNVVVDGSFEEPFGTFWAEAGVHVMQLNFSNADACDGDAYINLLDYDSQGVLWGTGDKQVLLAANTACVEWSYSGRAATPDVYVWLALAFEGTPYVVNSLTGSGGLYMQAQTWTLYHGECQLTIPGAYSHINVFMSIDDDMDPNDPDIIADFDSVVVRPVPCKLSTPLCDVEP